MARVGVLVALTATVVGFLAPSARAGTALVLTDGQVIKGTDVRRDGESFLITMANGAVVPFPAALVKEVKLEDDAPAKAPPGIDYSRPQTLAGPELRPQDPAQQQKVFGPPTQWSKSVVDTTWVPTNAYDTSKDVMANSKSTWSKSVVDTTWVPTNAYDTSKDVMANTKSTWSASVVDTTWKPTDGFGFKPLSSSESAKVKSYPMTFAAPAPIEAPHVASVGPSPWSCGEAIFANDHDASKSANRASSIAVHALKEPRYAALGVPLYEAKAKVASGQQRAIFTITGGQCRLIGGDADAILGMNLTAEHTMAQDAASFNAAMAMRGGARVPPGVDPLDFALAFLSVTDPTISGTTGATLKIVATTFELKAIADKMATTCPEGKSKKRKEARAASSAFAAPKIVASHEGNVATFMTWSSSGGTVCKNTVVLAGDGVISARREVVAAHVGDHKE